MTGQIGRRQIARATVLTNPASGHGNAPHATERAIAQFQRRGVDAITRFIEEKGGL